MKKNQLGPIVLCSAGFQFWHVHGADGFYSAGAHFWNANAEDNVNLPTGTAASDNQLAWQSLTTSSAHESFVEGEVVGSYKVLAKLGSGAFGAVFKVSSANNPGNHSI